MNPSVSTPHAAAHGLVAVGHPHASTDAQGLGNRSSVICTSEHSMQFPVQTREHLRREGISWKEGSEEGRKDRRDSFGFLLTQLCVMFLETAPAFEAKDRDLTPGFATYRCVTLTESLHL